LSTYTGTVVFVSHDRYFIDKLATRVFEIGEGRVEVYPGNYEDYRWRKEGGAARLQESVEVSTNPPQPTNGSKAPAPVDSVEAKSKRLNPIRRKQLEDRVRELEGAISHAEIAITDCETALQTFVSAEETARLTQALGGHRAELQTHMAEWEELAQALQS
jgi:ATP-binding cassette subfamily F protein 3